MRPISIRLAALDLALATVAFFVVARATPEEQPVIALVALTIAAAIGISRRILAPPRGERHTDIQDLLGT